MTSMRSSCYSFTLSIRAEKKPRRRLLHGQPCREDCPLKSDHLNVPLSIFSKYMYTQACLVHGSCEPRHRLYKAHANIKPKPPSRPETYAILAAVAPAPGKKLQLVFVPNIIADEAYD